MGELLTLRGHVSGTGDYTLQGDVLYGSVAHVRIPKGMKAKVWAKRIAGEAARVKLMFTHDVTVSSPAWVEVGAEYLASPGEIVLEKRRPIILRGLTGKEAFKLTRDVGDGDSYVDIDVELAEDDE